MLTPLGIFYCVVSFSFVLVRQLFPGSSLLHGDYQSDQPSVQLTAGSLPLLKFSKTQTVCKQRVHASAEGSMSGLCLAAPCHKNTLNAFLMSCSLPLSSCAPVVRMVSHGVLGLSNPWAALADHEELGLSLWSANVKAEGGGRRRDFELKRLLSSANYNCLIVKAETCGARSAALCALTPFLGLTRGSLFRRQYGRHLQEPPAGTLNKSHGALQDLTVKLFTQLFCRHQQNTDRESEETPALWHLHNILLFWTVTIEMTVKMVSNEVVLRMGKGRSLMCVHKLGLSNDRSGIKMVMVAITKL